MKTKLLLIIGIATVATSGFAQATNAGVQLTADQIAKLNNSIDSIVPLLPGQPTDPGFELPSVGSGGSAFQYAPAGSPWTFSGTAGVAGNASGFTSGDPSSSCNNPPDHFMRLVHAATQRLRASAATQRALNPAFPAR